jgi:hypothetical protein
VIINFVILKHTVSSTTSKSAELSYP